MRYRRNEGFRLEFGQPLDIQFRLEDGNGERTVSSSGDAKMLDISLQGMKIETDLNMPANRPSMSILVDYRIHKNNYQTRGQIVWKKPRANQWQYGIQFSHEEEIETQLLKDLKAFAKDQEHA
ncbi:PilZ domain-containing protein [Lentibacillus sp. JNUCC-1]|uniref:PilZ domain-containing protein n=1 Tax=Lentibacillus sp. JNUCC-1 TaxID=2654513 RepID=UPI001E40C393|nr:PilZ domain-containing protein [Lentibacillus sp. JNUCC-1]